MTDVQAPSERATLAADTARPSRRPLLVACGAAFVAFLDLSVVNIAFPAISDDFTDVTAASLTWVVSGYAVAFAALLTPAGRLADELGRRAVFLWALAGFAITSLWCALAPSAGWLIAGRLAQGAAAALMIPAGLGLVLSRTAPERIGASIAAWTAAGGAAAAVGPALGGALVEWSGWRAVFFINVPVVLVLIGLGRSVPGDASREHRGAPDWWGTVAGALGIGGVVAAITEGQEWGWGSWRTPVCLGAGAALLALALVRSFRHPRPAVAVQLWRHRTYALANATSFVFGAAMFAWLLGGPLWLDRIWHYSVLESAGAMTIGAVASIATAVIAGRLPRHQRAVAVTGALLFASAALYMSTDVWGHTPELWLAWVPAGILGGGAIGLTVTALGAASAGALPPAQFATGVGMNLTARQAGGALGVAVLAAISATDRSALDALHLVFAVCGGIALVAALCAAFLHTNHGESA